MYSKNINSPILELTDGLIVRLLPNIDDNGLIADEYVQVPWAWNIQDRYVINDNLDYPIMSDVSNLEHKLKSEGKESLFSIGAHRYYMYCLDHKFNIKILRFGVKLHNIISAEIYNNVGFVNILNPMSGRALKISKKSVNTPGGIFPSFNDSAFIDVEPLSVGVDKDSIHSYIMNNREVSIEKFVNDISWYRSDYRRQIIKTLYELDPVRFDYIKKFGREDVINDLLGENS